MNKTFSLRLLPLALPILFFLAGYSFAADRNTITISAVGDIMMGTTFPKEILPPEDGALIFLGVHEHLKGADILFGNLEGPVTDEGEPQKCKSESETCYEFRTPARYVKYLREAGFNVVNIANNHATDFGREGLEATFSVLRKERIQAVGGERIAYMGIDGKRVAIVGFSYVDKNPCSFSILNISEAINIVSELNEKNDIVIVSFHGGAEGKDATNIPDGEEVYLGEKRGDVKLFAHAVIDAGADIVIGHGPHVLRALELYKGKLIAYSLGNFLTYERFNVSGPNGISMILKTVIDADTGDFVQGTIVPVQLGESGVPGIDQEKRAIALLKMLIYDNFPNQALKIDDEGIVEPIYAY